MCGTKQATRGGGRGGARAQVENAWKTRRSELAPAVHVLGVLMSGAMQVLDRCGRLVGPTATGAPGLLRVL